MGRHQRIFEQCRTFHIGRIAEIAIPPVRGVDGAAENPVERDVPHLAGPPVEKRQKRLAENMRPRRLAVKRQQGRHQVCRLGQCRNPLAAAGRQFRMPDHQRDLRHLVIEGHAVLCPPVMFREQEPVIRRHYDGRVVPAIMLVQMVEDAPELRIAQPHQRGIIGAKLGHFLGRLVDGLVAWPVQHWPLIAGVAVTVAVRCMKRLMRVEGFHLQHPAVCAGILGHELQGGIDTSHHREITLVLHPRAVDHTLQAVAVPVILELQRVILLAEAVDRRLHHRCPRV